MGHVWIRQQGQWEAHNKEIWKAMFLPERTCHRQKIHCIIRSQTYGCDCDWADAVWKVV